MATISFSMHRFVRLLLFGQFWLFQNLLLYSLQSENRFSSATRLNLLSSPLASVLTGRRSANPFKSHSNRNALKFSSGRHTESSWLPSISEETYLVDNDASYFWPSTALPIQWPSTNTEAIIRPVRLANRPLHDDLPILNLGPVRSNRPSRIPNRKTKRRKRKPSKSKRYRSKSTLIAKPTAWIDYSTLLPAVPISLYDPSYMSFLQANTHTESTSSKSSSSKSKKSRKRSRKTSNKSRSKSNPSTAIIIKKIEAPSVVIEGSLIGAKRPKSNLNTRLKLLPFDQYDSSQSVTSELAEVEHSLPSASYHHQLSPSSSPIASSISSSSSDLNDLKWTIIQQQIRSILENSVKSNTPTNSPEFLSMQITPSSSSSSASPSSGPVAQTTYPQLGHVQYARPAEVYFKQNQVHSNSPQIYWPNHQLTLVNGQMEKHQKPKSSMYSSSVPSQVHLENTSPNGNQMTTLRNLRLQIPNNIPDSQLPMEFGRQLVKHLMSMEAGLSSNPSNDANTNSGQSITGHSNQIQLPQTILSRGMGDDSVRFGETLSNSDKSGLTLIQLPSSSNDQNQSPQFVIRPVSTSNTFANPFATNSVQIPVFDLHPYIVDKPESSLADALNKEEPAESKEINLMSSLFSLANSADKSDASAFRYRYFPSKTQSSSSSASSAESALVPVSSSSLSPSLSFLNQSDSPILLLEQLRR